MMLTIEAGNNKGMGQEGTETEGKQRAAIKIADPGSMGLCFRVAYAVVA